MKYLIVCCTAYVPSYLLQAVLCVSKNDVRRASGILIFKPIHTAQSNRSKLPYTSETINTRLSRIIQVEMLSTHVMAMDST